MESTRKQLITLLAKNKYRYVSGQSLSEELNISRSAVWKHMNELKKDGFIIEGVPKKGYKVTGLPEKVSDNTIQWGLNTKWLGHHIVHKQTTSSTQHVAHQKVREDGGHGTVIVADKQTKGKGRMNRKWHSSHHQGVWMSIILKPVLAPQLAPQLTLLTATVLADVISASSQLKPQIKWPNDILINEKKVAGILTEMQAEQDQIQYIVIGIGMNVHHDLEVLPSELKNKATSLKIESRSAWNLRKLIQDILVQFEKTYDIYLNQGFPKIKHKWESYGFKIGEPILIKTLNKQWEAIFDGIAEDGALMVKNNDDTIQKVYSAEIEWFETEMEIE